MPGRHSHRVTALVNERTSNINGAPANAYPEVVITLDNAPWRDALMEQVLQEQPHLRLKRLPIYSPQLNAIECHWRVLRRRPTHKATVRQYGCAAGAFTEQSLLLPDYATEGALVN